jgi:hypothetical protein
MWRRLAAFFRKHPRQCIELVFCLFIAESWQRQFRGPNPPTTALRQIWQPAVHVVKATVIALPCLPPVP